MLVPCSGMYAVQEVEMGGFVFWIGYCFFLCKERNHELGIIDVGGGDS